MKKLIQISFFFFFPFISFAQLYSNIEEDEISYIDSVIYAWKIDPVSLSKNSVDVDTNLTSFQLYNPVRRNGDFYYYLGGFGSATFNTNYFNTLDPEGFIFTKSYNPYIQNYKKNIYYNTKRPYTNLGYSSNMFMSKDKMDQNLSVIHTQNINKNLNVGVTYNSINANGIYLNQLNKVNSFSLFNSFNSLYYNQYSDINLNSIINQHNGGLETFDFYNDSSVNKGKERPVILTNTIPVYEKSKNKNLFLFHQLNIGKTTKKDTILILDSANKVYDTIKQIDFKEYFNINHRITYDNSYRLYIDDNPTGYGFYNNVYSTKSLIDSVSSKKLDNELFVDINTINDFTFRSGVNSQIIYNGYLEHNRDSTLDSTIIRNNLFNNYFSTGFFNSFNSKTHFSLFINYCFAGYQKSNYNGSFEIIRYLKSDTVLKPFIKFNLLYNTQKPDLLYQHYSSNYLKWDKDLLETKKQQFNIAYSIPKYKFNIGVDYCDEDNFIYLNQRYKIQQYNRRLSIFSSYINKEFIVGKVHSKNNIRFNRVSNNYILSLPMWTLCNTTYLNQKIHFKTTGGNIDFQLGFNLYYSTEYNAYSYRPEINMFYLSNMYILGNYPLLDVFLNIKIKRVRMFLMYEHANQSFMDKKYLYIWHYPLYESIIKLGLSWNFYN